MCKHNGDASGLSFDTTRKEKDESWSDLDSRTSSYSTEKKDAFLLTHAHRCHRHRHRHRQRDCVHGQGILIDENHQSIMNNINQFGLVYWQHCKYLYVRTKLVSYVRSTNAAARWRVYRLYWWCGKLDLLFFPHWLSGDGIGQSNLELIPTYGT